MLLAHGFETLRLPELFAFVEAPNAASQRLMRRLGFAPAGEADGPRCPLTVWRLRRRDWAAGTG